MIRYKKMSERIVPKSIILELEEYPLTKEASINISGDTVSAEGMKINYLDAYKLYSKIIDFIKKEIKRGK